MPEEAGASSGGAPADHHSAARLKAEAEVAEAKRALEGAVPGSVVAGWIERRLEGARRALAAIEGGRADDARPEASASPLAINPVMKLRVEVEGADASSIEQQHKGHPTSELLSPVTAAWLSRPASLLSPRGGFAAWPTAAAAAAGGERCRPLSLAPPRSSPAASPLRPPVVSRKRSPSDAGLPLPLPSPQRLRVLVPPGGGSSDDDSDSDGA